MSGITPKDVERIVLLSRIRFSVKEKKKMVRELGAILGYIDKLKEVDTEGVEPVAHITGLENVLREDEPNKKPLRRGAGAADAGKLVRMAPEKKDNYVKVKAVFEKK